jgi:hypothetical protein
MGVETDAEALALAIEPGLAEEPVGRAE